MMNSVKTLTSEAASFPNFPSGCEIAVIKFVHCSLMAINLSHTEEWLAPPSMSF